MSKLNRLEYDGVSYQEWSEPSLEDLTAGDEGVERTSEWDDLDREAKRHVRSHFLVTTGETGSDGLPEDFGGLKLPLVTPNHKLSKAAVDNAAARLNQVEGLGDAETRARSRIRTLQDEELGE